MASCSTLISVGKQPGSLFKNFKEITKKNKSNFCILNKVNVANHFGKNTQQEHLV